MRECIKAGQMFTNIAAKEASVKYNCTDDTPVVSRAYAVSLTCQEGRT